MGQKAANMIGEKYGKLTIISRDYNVFDKKNSWWKCECECGIVKSYSRKDLIKKKGGVKSCGCSQHESKLKYRSSNSIEYECWQGMKSRCYNKNRPGYKNYGGRGIIICDRWLNSFDNFFEDMGAKPYPEASIERIDNDGNYEPLNCKWGSKKEQNRNRRYNVISSKQVADDIRTLYKSGNYTQKELSNLYNCEESIIWQIINNYSWA
jgi:hypothetical protein